MATATVSVIRFGDRRVVGLRNGTCFAKAPDPACQGSREFVTVTQSIRSAAELLNGAPRSPLHEQRAADETCRHCGAALGDGSPSGFCCAGCREVHALLRAENLERYYDLRGDSGQPVAETHQESRDRKWLEIIEARQAVSGGLTRIDLDVQGMHCTGCVWLLEELFKRHAGGTRLLVNPSLGTADLVVETVFPIRTYVEQVERFGYVLGPAVKRRGAEKSDLLLRMGVCVAIAMNSMIFGISLYAGLEGGVLFRLFHLINFGLSCASVAVGGTVFFRSAYRGLKSGLLHLDLPIALGIALSFAGSTRSLVVGGGRASYFDTVNVFIALMLVGRWLQERVIEQNRAQLLDSQGVDSLLTKRLVAGRIEIVPVREVRTEDMLLIAPSDVLPVDASLEEDLASFSFDWITGESASRDHRKGDVLPAGAAVAGARAVRVQARQDFAASSLIGLLRSPTPRPTDAARVTAWWMGVTRRYVVLVLCTAALGFAWWAATTGDIGRSIDVVTAILTVTCPCAFGLATPLAYELVQARLRRQGLLIRSPGFLDRAPAVRRIVFDKTGTLTTGVLRIESAGDLDGLAPAVLQVLYNLAARSTHPKSVAIKRALAGRGLVFDADLLVEEEVGRGLVAQTEGHTYRLGSPAWASVETKDLGSDTVFSMDGEVQAAFSTAEELRPDARSEVAALTQSGYEVWILSGDARERVLVLADAAGIPSDRVVADSTPEGKAAWLKEHDRGDTLMLGDGLNDSLAVSVAHCSGTPAIDRPFLAARSDFYLVTAGLLPIRLALEASHELRRVVRRTLGAAAAYNVIAISLACAGRMSPLLCAVFMPLSSLSVLLATTASLSQGKARATPFRATSVGSPSRASTPDILSSGHPVRLSNEAPSWK